MSTAVPDVPSTIFDGIWASTARSVTTSPCIHLLNGSCIMPGDIVAPNDPADGTGTLVPGPATFELELKQSDGTSETILDTRTIPITLG